MSSNPQLLGHSKQRELFPKHQFLVEIESGTSAGFQKCSELSFEVGKIEYWEGGSIIPWKAPGRVTVADLTLERGASSSIIFFAWATEVANASLGQFPTRGAGLATDTYMRNITIRQLDRDGQTSMREWAVYNAWVQKFVAGEWDNTADEAVIESLTLTYDWFQIMV
jgi:phage tail-like protein